MTVPFNLLARRDGAYSLPYLIKLYDPSETIVMYLVNNNENIIYNGITYIASTFEYTPNASESGFNGGGSLKIAIKDNQVVDLIETYREVKLDVIGILNKADGTITELRTYRHHYCEVSGDRTNAVFTFSRDDRLDMTFPALIWNAANNRGNS